jgi:hypothetical protein
MFAGSFAIVVGVLSGGAMLGSSQGQTSIMTKNSDDSVNAEEVLMAEHLMINIGQMHDMYDEISKNVEAILKVYPNDVEALFVKALYTACAMHNMNNEDLKLFRPGNDHTTVESTEEWKALNAVSPYFGSVLKRVADDAVNAWDSEFSPSGVVPLDTVLSSNYPGTLVIGIFGWGPITGNDDDGWTALPPMQERIDAGFKLAEHFKEAQIIASGGAVTSGKVEGVYINEQLTERDETLGKRIVVDPSARDSQGNAEFIAEWIQSNTKGDVTVLIVGSDWQDPRFRAIVGGVFESMDITATIVPVGAGMKFVDGLTDPQESDPLAARIHVEQIAIYRDLARARGYYEECDFEQGADKPEDDAIQETYTPIEVGDESVTPTKGMQSLKPRIGRCYVGDQKILPAVRLWRERKQHQALKLLHSMIPPSRRLGLRAHPNAIR